MTERKKSKPVSNKYDKKNGMCSTKRAQEGEKKMAKNLVTVHHSNLTTNSCVPKQLAIARHTIHIGVIASKHNRPVESKSWTASHSPVGSKQPQQLSRRLVETVQLCII